MDAQKSVDSLIPSYKPSVFSTDAGILAPSTPRTHSKMFLRITIGIVVVVLAIVGIYLLLPRNSIVIKDQALDKTIYIERLHLKQSGTLLIRKVSAIGGVYTIASSSFLPPEDYRKFRLPIWEQIGPLESLDSLESGDQLYATIYEDVDGDKSVNHVVDSPIKDIFGREVRVDFRIL